MLIGNYKNIECGKENFKIAFEWLRSEKWKSLAVGTYEIKGREVYAMVQEYDSRSLDVAKYEKHKKYADVQMVIEGQELMISTTDDSIIGTSLDGFDSEKDIIFFSTYTKGASKIVMDPGLVCVLFPEDAHIPCVVYKTSQKIHKLVIKVAV